MKRIVITGGGTGGHLSIARALGIECARRGFEVIYIGSNSGQDRTWFENSEIFSHKYFLNSTGVVNKRGFGLVKSMWMQVCAVLKSRQILRKHKIDFVISVGGFSAGGGSLAAILSRTSLFIHEQNSVSGMLNRILTPFARAIFGSFKIECKNFIRTAYPIDEIYHKSARVREKISTIIFLGGSQGAVAINDFALRVSSELLKRDIHIIHQCGKRDFERVKSAYNALHSDKITLFDFSDDLVRFVGRADFCVSRAGAGAIWELCANALPCYFVPYPFAAKNHQFHNAQFLKERGLCEVVEQKNLDEGAFLAYIDTMNGADSAIYAPDSAKNDMDSAIFPSNLAQISAKLANLPHKNGSKEIVDKILEIL